ncbi:MAG: S-layer homology domain-containing protein [Clostridiales bacterium]|jgi:hypothetical protein|nr:S-layer homology domain-containing protein [Clostridiales bacterium]
MKYSGKRIKACLAVFTAIVLCLAMATSAAAQFTDIEGHWAQSAVEKWSGLGVIPEDGGYFRPDENITVAEFAAMLDKIMGYRVAAQGAYADLEGSSQDVMLRAIAAGYLSADRSGNVNPNAALTRHGMAVILANVFKLQAVPGKTTFTDDADIPAYARTAVKALQKNTVITGFQTDNGYEFRPNNNVTRAEAVVFIEMLAKNLISEAGTYTKDVSGTLIINTTGVTLNGVSISGDLILAEGIGDGDITLRGVTVAGTTYVNGGGQNTITISGGTSLNTVIVSKDGGEPVRMKFSDDSSALNILVRPNRGLIVSGGSVASLTVEANADIVIADGATVNRIVVNGDGTEITIQKGSVIETLRISADGVTVTSDGEVKHFVNASGDPNVKITTSTASVSNIDAPSKPDTSENPPVSSTPVPPATDPGPGPGPNEPPVIPPDPAAGAKAELAKFKAPSAASLALANNLNTVGDLTDAILAASPGLNTGSGVNQYGYWIRVYEAASGGDPLVGTAVLKAQAYYAAFEVWHNTNTTVNRAASAYRMALYVTSPGVVDPAAGAKAQLAKVVVPGAAQLVLANGANTVQTLMNTLNSAAVGFDQSYNLWYKVYETAAGGEALSAGAVLTARTYYVYVLVEEKANPTVNFAESAARLAVPVTEAGDTDPAAGAKALIAKYGTPTAEMLRLADGVNTVQEVYYKALRLTFPQDEIEGAFDINDPDGYTARWHYSRVPYFINGNTATWDNTYRGDEILRPGVIYISLWVESNANPLVDRAEKVFEMNVTATPDYVDPAAGSAALFVKLKTPSAEALKLANGALAVTELGFAIRDTAEGDWPDEYEWWADYYATPDGVEMLPYETVMIPGATYYVSYGVRSKTNPNDYTRSTVRMALTVTELTGNFNDGAMALLAGFREPSAEALKLANGTLTVTELGNAIRDTVEGDWPEGYNWWADYYAAPTGGEMLPYDTILIPGSTYYVQYGVWHSANRRDYAESTVRMALTVTELTGNLNDGAMAEPAKFTAPDPLRLAFADGYTTIEGTLNNYRFWMKPGERLDYDNYNWFLGVYDVKEGGEPIDTANTPIAEGVYYFSIRVENRTGPSDTAEFSERVEFRVTKALGAEALVGMLTPPPASDLVMADGQNDITDLYTSVMDYMYYNFPMDQYNYHIWIHYDQTGGNERPYNDTVLPPYTYYAEIQLTNRYNAADTATTPVWLALPVTAPAGVTAAEFMGFPDIDAAADDPAA